MADILELSKQQEENLIGSLLKDPSQLDLVASIVTPDDFHIHTMGWAFEAMLKLKERGLGIDTVTLGDELERHGKMQDFVIGSLCGRLALADLRANFRGDHPRSYANKVLGYSAKRKMIDEAGLMATWGNNGREPSEIRNDMIRRLTDIRVPNEKANKHTQTFKEALSQNWDEVNNGNVSFVPSGFIDVDRVLGGGFYAPDFLVVAGRPGTGKSSWMLSVAMHAAKKGKRVVMFNLEMSNSQIIMRAASMETGIPFKKMRSRSMNDQQKEQYNAFIEEFENLPLHLNDMPAIKISEIRQTLHEIAALHGGIDMVIVDYLQLQGADGKHNNRQEEVSSVSRGLKAIAKEFNVPVIAGAQLSRAVEQRSEKKPVLSDLRESGSIEQDSDVVTFIYTMDEFKETRSVDFIFAKHRNGPVGAIPLLFQSKRTRFVDAVSKTFTAEAL